MCRGRHRLSRFAGDLRWTSIIRLERSNFPTSWAHFCVRRSRPETRSGRRQPKEECFLFPSSRISRAGHARWPVEFVPAEPAEDQPGTRLTNLEYAPLAEITGRIPWSPEVFNCNSPDSGNMEILQLCATPDQRERWLNPLLDGAMRSCFSMTEPATASWIPPTWRQRSGGMEITIAFAAGSGSRPAPGIRTAASRSSWDAAIPAKPAKRTSVFQ